MARRKDPFTRERIRLDGYQRMPISDPRDQLFWDWYCRNRANRQAYPIAIELIKAALNGELGERVQAAVVAGNQAETMEALQDLIGAWGGDG